MAPRPIGIRPAHASRWLAIAFAAGLLATLGLVIGRPRPQAAGRLVADAASRGWLLVASKQEVGALSSILRNARFANPQIPGATAEIEKIEVRHWPWLRPKVTVSGVRARLDGEPAAMLRAIASLAGFGDTPTVEGDVNAVYSHRAMGSVELDGVTGRFRGPNLVLHARQVRIGKRSWQEVSLVLEPRQEMVLIAPGDDVTRTRIQLSCFPSSGGKSRWLLDIPHQAVRPLTRRVGWDLGSDFDAARVAGSLSLDCPDNAGEPIQGRVQLVLDRWPSGAPPDAEAILGQTLSLLSNVVPAADGSGWDLPRVEVTSLVFKLTGKGHVDLGEHAQLRLDGAGERTCRQLQALVPPSDQRERVSRYLAERGGEAGQTAGTEQIRLGLRWNLAAGTETHPIWNLEGGCGLAGWASIAGPTPR